MTDSKRDLSELNSHAFRIKLIVAARKMVGSPPRFPDKDAEDFVQDAIVKLLDDPTIWDPGKGDLSAFLYWRVRGSISNYAAKNWITMRQHVGADGVPDTVAKENVEENVLIRQVERAIRMLADHPGSGLRDIAVFFLESRSASPKDVGEALGIDYETAKRRVRQLKDCLHRHVSGNIQPQPETWGPRAKKRPLEEA